MKKYMVKVELKAVKVVEGKSEEEAKREFTKSIKEIVSNLQEKNPSIKFSVDYFVNTTELPEEI